MIFLIFFSRIGIYDLVQVMHVLGFDPHAFAHFRDERKRRRNQVIATMLQNLT